jgi:hypothetical protein
MTTTGATGLSSACRNARPSCATCRCDVPGTGVTSAILRACVVCVCVCVCVCGVCVCGVCLCVAGRGRGEVVLLLLVVVVGAGVARRRRRGAAGPPGVAERNWRARQQGGASTNSRARLPGSCGAEQ